MAVMGLPRSAVVRRLAVALTDACNLRCAYCFQRLKGSRRLAWDSLRRALDLLLASRTGAVRLSFTGGEPLLAFPMVVRAAGYAEARRPPSLRVEYDIVTNGLLLGEEQIAFLVEHDFRVDLSFDGVPAAQDLRGPRTFPVLDELLARLAHEHPAWFAKRLRVAMTLCRANLPWLADSVEYFLERGVQRIALSPALTRDYGWTPAHSRRLDQQFRRVYGLSVRHYRRTGRIPFLLLRKPAPTVGRPGRRDAMCRIGAGDQLALDATGQAYPCLLFTDTYRAEHSPLLEATARRLALGAVTDPAFVDRLAVLPRAVRTARLLGAKSRKYSSDKRCADCEYLERCTVCPASIAVVSGNRDPDRIPDFQCAFTRIALKYQDRFLGQPGLRELLAYLERNGGIAAAKHSAPAC